MPSNSRSNLHKSALKIFAIGPLEALQLIGRSPPPRDRVWEMKCHELSVNKAFFIPPLVFVMYVVICTYKMCTCMGGWDKKEGWVEGYRKMCKAWRASDLFRTGLHWRSWYQLYLRLTKSEKAPIEPLFPPTLGGRQVGTARSIRWEVWGRQ